MKALPQQSRALRKRELLITAGAAEFAEVGFEVATSKSIAARAGVATGTFYQHFENKNELLQLIATQRFARLAENILPIQLSGQDKSVREVFHDVLNFTYAYHNDEPQLHQVLEQRRGQDTQLHDIMREGERMLELRVREFVAQFAVPDVEIVTQNLFGMAEGLVHRHVFDTSAGEQQQVVDLGADMLAAYFDQFIGD